MQAVHLGRGWGHCWLGGRRGADPSFSVETQRWGGPRPSTWHGSVQGLGRPGSVMRADLGWRPMACLSPFQSSAHCWSPVWKREETGPGYPLADVQLSQAKHHHGIQGLPLSLLGSWVETVLDSCTNLCTPLYICYIECIYVGNMLASVCRCCVSCAPQRRALTWPWPGRG